MRKLTSLLLTSLTLLTGCATAPAVVVKAVCPQIPALDEVVIPPPFLEKMQQWLSTSQPMQTSYELLSPNAKPNTPKLGVNSPEKTHD